MHALFGYADVPLWLTIVRTALDGAHAIRERATSTNLPCSRERAGGQNGVCERYGAMVDEL